MNAIPVTKSQRSPSLAEKDFIEKMAKLLATESGLSSAWISNVLKNTLPENEIVGLRKDSAPTVLLYQFTPCLFEAMRWLSKDEVKDLFSGDLNQLSLLEKEYDSIVDEIPFESFDEMSELFEEFKEYLEAEEPAIIDTGYPKKPFHKNLWLQDTFTESFVPRREKRYLLDAQGEFLSTWISANADKKRLDQFKDGILSEGFLAKQLGKKYRASSLEIKKGTAALRDRLKASLFSKAKENHPYENLVLQLKREKIKVPHGLLAVEKAYRVKLHDFSKKAFSLFIESYETDEPEKLLHKLWDLLSDTFNHKELDLLFNSNLVAFGILKPKSSQVTYKYGQKLIERVFHAASIIVHQSTDGFLNDIYSALDDVRDEFEDQKNGLIEPITYSLYQAIYILGEDAVREACSKYYHTKKQLEHIRAGVKKSSKNALEVAFQKLRESRKAWAEQEFLRLSTGVEKPIPVRQQSSKVTTEAVNPISVGVFTEGYWEYHSCNPAYEGMFKFESPLKRSALQKLHEAYQSTDPRVTVYDLLHFLYNAEEANGACPSSS